MQFIAISISIAVPEIKAQNYIKDYEYNLFYIICKERVHRFSHQIDTQRS